MKHTEQNAAKAKSPEKKQSQKYIVIGVLAVLAVIIVVALVVLLRGCTGPSGTNGNYEGSFTSPNSVLGYSNGQIPTTGNRHDVTVTGDGGPDAMEVMGNWRIDEITVYKFDGYGRGVMLTAVDNYTFAYCAINGHLIIDFDVDNAMDSDYTYKVNGNKMTISRNGQDFNFTKEP